MTIFNRLFTFIFFLPLMMGIPASNASEIPLLRDFILTGSMPHGHWEVSLDFVKMNDAIDIFDFRSKELSSNSLKNKDVIGDYKGGRVMVNHGFASHTNLHFEYSLLNLETGPVDLDMDVFELSLRQQLPRQGFLSFAMDLGGRFNNGDDKTIGDVGDIDTYIKRINSRYSIAETPSHYIFRDQNVNLFASKTGRPALQVSLDKMHDQSYFLRFIAGADMEKMRPNLFAELGVTKIGSRISSNFLEFFPDSFQNQFDTFPVDLNRRERYWKMGFNLLFFAPFGLLANIKYEYVKMDRDGGLDYVDYNHIVNADLTCPISDTFALNLGATYLRRQFNAVLPYTYNRYTQTTFDHDYGFVRLGLVAKF